MNILFVITSLIKAGAERATVNACNELVKDNQNKVAIFLLEDKNEFESELDERIEVYGGGISFHLSLYRKNRIENSRYIDFVNKFKPDVIHSHLFLSDMLTHSHHFEGVRYFSHIHNSTIVNYDGFIWSRITSKRMWTDLYEYNWLVQRYRSFGTNFIACSAGAQKLHEKRIRVGKVITLPNASPLPEVDLSSKQIGEILQLVWVGRLNDVKRPQMVISIAHGLKERGLNFKLKLAGVGPEMEICKELIQELSLSNEVEMLGLVDDVHPLYSQANLLIHTSRYEGLPLVFIEAGAHGIPIITTDCVPQNDIIENGLNGEIITSEDINDFISVILEIANDPDKLRELSQNALSKATEFGIVPYVEKLMRFYKMD